MDTQYKGMGQESIKAIWKEAKAVFVEKEDGKGLSSEDFTANLKQRLEDLTKDYEELDNLPAIEGVELTKDTTWDDLKLHFHLQTALDNYQPRVNTNSSEAYDSSTFGEGTYAEWFTVNHMTTVRLTVVVIETPDPPIKNYNPVRVFTEILPPAHDDGWIHLGRYSDVENVILEFQVDESGVLYMVSQGQIPSDRTYHITFSYISK